MNPRLPLELHLLDSHSHTAVMGTHICAAPSVSRETFREDQFIQVSNLARQLELGAFAAITTGITAVSKQPST